MNTLVGNFQLHAFIDGKHASDNTKFIFYLALFFGNCMLQKLVLKWICILRAQVGGVTEGVKGEARQAGL